jgi:hypothetical protein
MSFVPPFFMVIENGRVSLSISEKNGILFPIIYPLDGDYIYVLGSGCQ